MFYNQKRRKRFLNNVEKKKFKQKVKNELISIVDKQEQCYSTLPTLKVSFGKKVLENALIDTGSSINLINEFMLRRLTAKNIVTEITHADIDCKTAVNTAIEIIGRCRTKIKINKFSWYMDFVIAKNLAWNVILGADFIRKSQMLLNLSEDRYSFGFEPDCKLEFASNASVIVHKTSDSKIKVGCNKALSDVTKLITEFPNVFTDKIGEALNFEYTIKLKDKDPVNLRPYQLNPHKMQIMKDLIDDLLKQGVVEPSLSSYASPTFLVKKPNSDKYRLVVNYSELNKKIERVNYPIGDMHDIYHYLQGSEYFSVIDLCNSFHQIKLSEDCRDYTAFVTPFSQLRFCRIPYGLHSH